jgi:UDP-4-amino-4,6-dideoxy-N-acetyl-beta-L-altrosamine N-acetyltransferase
MNSFGTLRPIRDDEVMLMLEWRNHPNVRENMYNHHLISPEEHTQWWKSTVQKADKRYFMYEFDENACGIVGFTEIEEDNRRASWAFYAAPEARRGTGSRMEFLALNYAFNNLALHKLCCEVLAFNQGVIKLHKRFGFSVEGILRSHRLMDDHFEDVYVFGLLESEWRGFAPELERQLAKSLLDIGQTK